MNHIGTFQFFAQFIKKLLRTLKLSDIISVFEKLNHSNEANYRTVSILPLVSKKIEKVMYDKLYEYIKNFSKPATVWIPYSNISYSDFYKNVKRA